MPTPSLEQFFAGFLCLSLTGKHLQILWNREIPQWREGASGAPELAGNPQVEPATLERCLAWNLELLLWESSTTDTGNATRLLHSQADCTPFRLAGKDDRLYDLAVPRLQGRVWTFSGDCPEVRRAVRHFRPQGEKDDPLPPLGNLLVRVRRIGLSRPVNVLEADDGALLSDVAPGGRLAWAALRTALLAVLWWQAWTRVFHRG